MIHTNKRIVLTTFGSFGDVHPYMALAIELKDRGHRVQIATSNIYKEKIEDAGIEFHAVRPDIPGIEHPETIALLERIMDPNKGAEVIIKELISDNIQFAYEDISEVARGADLFVTHPITFAGPIVAEELKLNWVSSLLAPVSLWSAYDPIVPPNAPWVSAILRRAGVTINRLVLGLVRARTKPWVAAVAKLRASRGLPPGRHPVLEGQHSPNLVLALFSRVMAAPQTDWPGNTLVTGFPFYDKRDETPISPELLRFLDAGPPPIVFTLGSSAVFVAGDFFHESIAAAKILGRRAVLLIGDERNLPKESLPDNIVAFDYAPYGELLPRASVIVHQGGIGTTGQALRAGRPMLVMPYNHDQPDNGSRVERLGVARTLTRSQYRAERVATELKALIDDSRYAKRAGEVAEIVISEQGTQTACDAIEKQLRVNS